MAVVGLGLVEILPNFFKFWTALRSERVLLKHGEEKRDGNDFRKITKKSEKERKRVKAREKND